MTGKSEAIERCAYCRDYVPVTPVGVGAQTSDTEALRATVKICQSCQGDGR
ncbi:hypothetical protein SAMN06269185_0144 [Natronoarchaeum philippinense]|uniref:Uncharacterized protein n=1 Tax=Natronoarchaeum philippinense TaxID=558529 RepID=A0A285N0D2_NATPI|nr:hypothetical protein [Natronoarchaeum philippinense]SNZ02914.1 hypothetical protein SAMN06269185_0144 [Natronoarchaeum philippinense]